MVAIDDHVASGDQHDYIYNATTQLEVKVSARRGEVTVRLYKGPADDGTLLREVTARAGSKAVSLNWEGPESDLTLHVIGNKANNQYSIRGFYWQIQTLSLSDPGQL